MPDDEEEDNGFIHDCVDENCPQFVQDGCGCDACCGHCADCLETVTPLIEWIADVIWCFGSPLAFPIIFCFDPETTETGGWKISMLESPAKRPMECCGAMTCCPCGQYYLRRQALGGDMSRYKLWQGMHDGPHCLATRCPGAPITIEAGTYGEDQCPDAFLCLEVWCLGGVWSTCCAFDVTRRLMKQERGLGSDPTEIRQEKCVAFFAEIASKLFQLACCLYCSSLCVGCLAQDSEGAQDFAGAAGRASRACCEIVNTLWRGIWSVKVIAIGCMSAQMIHEIDEGQGLTAPQSNTMER